MQRYHDTALFSLIIYYGEHGGLSHSPGGDSVSKAPPARTGVFTFWNNTRGLHVAELLLKH